MTDDAARQALLDLASGTARQQADAMLVIDAIITPIAKRLAPRVELDLDDAQQIARMAVWRAAASYDSSRRAAPLINVITRCAILGTAKNLDRQQHPTRRLTSLDAPQDTDREGEMTFAMLVVDHREPHPSARLEREDCRRSMRRLLRALQRVMTGIELAAVIGHRVDDRSYIAIAARSDVRLKSIDNALRRAAEKLDDIATHAEASEGRWRASDTLDRLAIATTATIALHVKRQQQRRDHIARARAYIPR